MSNYRIKPGQPAFEIVDGPFAGRKFIIGQIYHEIPQDEAHRFEKINPPAAKKQAVAKPEETKEANK